MFQGLIEKAHVFEGTFHLLVNNKLQNYIKNLNKRKNKHLELRMYTSYKKFISINLSFL